METIKINNIVKKDSGLVIVKYEAMHEVLGVLAPFKSGEATMNIKWQAQDVDYIEKDVGIGGTVSVLIVPKGDYINITKVDMKSAVKELNTIPSKEYDEGTKRVSLMPQREIGMCAGGMLKCWYYNHTAESPEEVYDMYHNFVQKIEQNG